VAVIGSSTDAHAELAEPVGRLLARCGVNLLTGGGRGAMECVARAYVESRPARGISLAVLPCADEDPATRPPGYPNPWIQLAVATHLPDRGTKGELPSSRNHLIVLTADAIIALPGADGTASELRLALQYGRPVVAYGHGAGTTVQIPETVPRIETLAALEGFLERVLAMPPSSDEQAFPS
jgi:uncharacterized protein (TIGR00725 family)